MQDHAFDLVIDGENINRFVDADSMGEVSQRCEGENIWDYRLDSVSAEIDKSYMDFKGIKTDKYQSLIKLTVLIYWYGNKILHGAIKNISYNEDAEIMEFDMWSIGMIANELKTSGLDSRWLGYPRSDGRTLERSLLQIIYSLNSRLQFEGYDFQLQQSANIDVVDFEFMESVEVNKIHENHSFTYNGYTWGKYGLYMIRHSNASGIYYLVYRKPDPFGWYSFDCFPITKDGIDFTTAISNDGVFPEDEDGYVLENVNHVIEDEGLLKNIQIQLGDLDDTDIIFQGSVRFGNIYYALVQYGDPDNSNELINDGNFHILKIEIIPDDKYIFDYNDGVSYGKIIRDFAIMTNSVCYFGTDLKLYFQSRNGITGLSRKHVENLKSQYIKNDPEFDPPDEFVIMDSVKDNLKAYYEEFLSGDFKRYTTNINKDEFEESDFPLMLKKLPTDFKNLDVGMIKAIKYREDLIEIESEKRVV